MAERAAKKESSSFVEVVIAVVQAVALALVIRTVLLQPFSIPSGSMIPTLLVGDYVLVTKWSYGYSKYSLPFSPDLFDGRILGSEPERGDVIVFRKPSDTDVDFIKRLIGLPGDTIQMRDGRLWINGEEVPVAPAGDFVEVKELQGPQGLIPRCVNDPVAEGGDCIKQRFTETLPGGRSHDILNITDGSFADDTPTFTVPEGQYFFMGDNRDNSEDSRFPQEIGGLGFVPSEYLIGRADRIMFSSAGRSLLYFWTWRADRFFKAVE